MSADSKLYSKMGKNADIDWAQYFKTYYDQNLRKNPKKAKKKKNL